MATQLDLQEQEQLDELKAFWKQYGDLITWVLILALAAFGAWRGWNWWQENQAAKAAALHEQLDIAVRAGDLERSVRAFSDLKERYGRTAYAEQGGLAVAKLQYDKSQPDAALSTLGWVADNATEDEYRTVARLRAAGVLLDRKQYDAAIKQLDAATAATYAALVADRRGDILLAQAKTEEAKASYLTAWKAMEPTLDYRRLVEAKLTALGAAPAEAASAAGGRP